MSTSWKEAEREVADFFGGTRRVRISYSEEIGDIIHPRLSIEVKYGKCIPKYLRVKDPTVLSTGDDKLYYLIPSMELDRLGIIEPSCNKLAGLAYRIMQKKKCVFLDKAMKQATRYNPTLIPLVCVKAKGMKGFVAIWGEDYSGTIDS